MLSKENNFHPNTLFKRSKMKLKASYKPTFSFLILMVFSFVVYGQEITLIDFGVSLQTTPGNWNNFTDQTQPATPINLIDNTGASTGEILTLTDSFDLNYINNQGTHAAGVSFDGSPLPMKASRDSFFGEDATFSGSLEPTGGFTLSGLEIGKYYSFTIFASRTGVSDIRDALYTITGNAGAQTATLDAANNTSNVATILNIQPDDMSGEITIQAETGPLNDNPFGFYYIGAIEMTKTSCLSTAIITTWDGSTWDNGIPDLTTVAIIDGGYDTATNGSFSACSLTINTGVTLTVDNSTYVEVENDVVANGTIIVQTQGNFVQNDNLGTFTVNASGTALVNKQTAVKQGWLYYTYWSSPVSGETIAGAFPNTPSDRRFWFNASNYLDTDGNDVDDNNDDWTISNGIDVMTPGIGYAAASSPFGLYPSTDIATFTGAFNTRNISTAISYNALNITGSWNFIGNPYPSAIDFIAFQAANSSVIDGAAYFWSQSLPPDSANPGNQVNNFNQNDYATYTIGTGGVAGANGIIPTQYIPSAQSFFIAGLANGNVTFTNAMRMADGTSNTQFFKSSNSKKNASPISNKIWINLTSDNGVFNQILMGYVEGATNGNDGMSYDAPKILSSESTILYTSIENSDKIFSVQGKAPSDLNEGEVIDLGFKTSINVATLYSLSIAQLQGAFLNGNTVYLKDNLLNKTHDLSASNYTFTSEVGEFNSRFQIGFNAQALSADAFELDENTLSIVELENDNIKFTVSNNSNIKSVAIFDVLGRQLYSLKGRNSTETYKLSNLNNSIFIAKVTLSSGAIITKKAIKK